MYIQLFILFVIYSSIEIVHNSTVTSSELRIKYAGQALNALERLLNFFELDADNLNLDGVYGLRIAQGQLDILDEFLSNEKVQIVDKNKYIKSLSIQIERIVNRSLIEIARDSSSYLQRFLILINKPFIIEYETRKINQNFIESDSRNSEFDEEESDACFAQLLGSTNRPNTTKCFITQSCWSMMTTKMTKDYLLTHQLLWFMTAKTIGCIDNRTISEIANKHLKNLELHYCSNIYHDAEMNINENFNQDLFLEQLLLCSIIGYDEFLRFDWLNTILSWQHSEYGCFTNKSNRKFKRHLLVEQEMVNGCLSHKSGLASGLLATYARVFLQY